MFFICTGKHLGKAMSSFRETRIKMGTVSGFNFECSEEVGSWKLEVGSWKLEVGSWKLEVGSWKLEVGSWKLEVHPVLDPRPPLPLPSSP